MKHLPQSIAPVGDSFNISTATAEQLWGESLPIPIPLNDSASRRERLRISACSEWVVRKWNIANSPTELSAVEFAEVASGEFQRLEKNGIAVISRALVASSTADSVFTVSPWLPSLRLASADEYATVVPKLRSYYDRPGEDFVLHDIDAPEQYSAFDAAEMPMLHDTDPRLAVLMAAKLFGVIRI